MKSWTRDEILELIRREFPTLLQTDAEMRHELVGVLAEVFPPRREFEEALVRIDRSLEAVERALEAFRAEMARIHAGQEDLGRRVERLDGKIDTTREELSGRIDTTREELIGRIDATRVELRDHIDATREELEKSLHEQITRLGQRWGVMSEDILRQVVRAIVQETYGGRVTEVEIDGEQYDIVIINGEHILLEVTSRATQKITRRLERKRAKYLDETGITPARVILATAQIHYTVVEKLREMGVEVLQPDILIEEEGTGTEP